MKKTTILLLICFVLIPCLYAQSNTPGYGIPGRSFEIGIAQTNLHFSNDFLTLSDIFQETAVIDIDRLQNGLNMDLNLGITPFYLSFNSKGNWGFGLSFGLSASGILGFNGDMLTFKETGDAKSNISGAAFVDANVSAFFHIMKLKVKVAPSVFYPLASVRGDVSYTNQPASSGNETFFNINYDLSVYTPFSLENGFGSFDISNLNGTPGVDINFGLEFPLAEAIGLSKKIRFLDFKLGVDVYNLPLIPGQLDNKMNVKGMIGSENSFNIFDIFSNDELIGDPEIGYSSEKISVLRPFKVMIWADWKPFGPWLRFIPTVGFSVNDSYSEISSFEYGLKARLDLFNVLIATFGVGYYERLWTNSLDIAFNLRLFEVNVGINMSSPDIEKCWLGSGLGVNFGLKFGW